MAIAVRKSQKSSQSGRRPAVSIFHDTLGTGKSKKFLHASFRHVRFPNAPSITETEVHGKHSEIYALAPPLRFTIKYI